MGYAESGDNDIAEVHMEGKRKESGDNDITEVHMEKERQ